MGTKTFPHKDENLEYRPLYGHTHTHTHTQNQHICSTWIHRL